AHNDYLHEVPFYSAYKSGFGSIEADVFLVNGDLLVAHGKSELQKDRTLSKLYLMPLKAELKKNPERRLILLIDIKEKYPEALSILVKQLKPLKKRLTTQNRQGQLLVVISGNRPLPSQYLNYPDYLYFDSDLSKTHTASEWKRVGLVSLQFSKISKWKGEGEISSKDKALLKQKIDSVHITGKKIRFWAAPDNEYAWNVLMKLGVDFIGTDKIEELTTFIKNL
ncbi:MAG TPA: phosphatidylinositol-specific phospholipase C/glycerophosphodiester phosphodiesterase family protein, partial [Sphingobacteriaceae bacterium]